MASLRTLTQAHRRLLLALFACAMLARALVPAGWMPMTGHDGGITIALCDGMAAPQVAMAGHHHMPEKAPASHDSSVEHPCAFAGAAAAMVDPVLPAILPVVAPRAAPIATATLAPAVGRGLAAPPPPPTGPPLLI